MGDKENQVKSMDKMLEEGLSEVFSADYYQRFLSFVSNNPNYSYRNVILILRQCSHASLTKGLRAWNKEKRLIKSGERGLRINACFDRDADKDKDKPPPVSFQKKQRQKSDSTFRKVNVYDISQTRAMDGDTAQGNSCAVSAGNTLAIACPPQTALGCERLLRDLCQAASITITDKTGTGHPLTAHAMIAQIALAWLRASCSDHEQLKLAARSVTYIVCRHLGLDASTFGFDQITGHSLGMEQAVLERFLDIVQKVALYFIDTLDGLREAHRTGYPADAYFLFTNKKTAMRLFRQGHYVYLVYPGQGELLAMNKKVVEQHENPFAVPREEWFCVGGTGGADVGGLAA